MSVAPDVLADIQAEFSREWQRLCDDARRGALAPPSDRRFAGEAWAANGQHLLMAHTYLLSARAMSRMVDAAQVSEPMRDRLRFSIMQWVDALSPSNFLALNPDAQRSIVESAGRALNEGLANLLGDVKKGRITQTDETQFEIGRNVATTPGDVVFENALFQLIQYKPVTATVHQIPLVIVPPNINKFYILDLQPENSLVRYAVEQGNTVFLVSWRNPKADLEKYTWEDYLEKAAITAIEVVRSVCKVDQINALGFCVGGTILSSALAVLAARGEDPVASLTLLTTLLDFSDTGEIGLLIDDNFLALKESQIGQGGLLSAKELSSTFSALRANDLVWNYVANNYLKGKKPDAFDLLYWNCDSTNLPGPFACWYMRNLYQNNSLRIPGKLEMCGVRVDLGRVAMPSYILAAREDHIVPWQTAYQSTRLLGGPSRFVLGASGHIAGVVNPAAKNKRSFWSGSDQKLDADSWLAAATEHKGSWWSDWSAWLQQFAGGEVAARSKLGNARYKPLEPAPGRYVKEKAV